MIFQMGMIAILVAFGAGLEAYDAARPDLDEDLIYNDFNSIEVGTFEPERREDPITQLLVYKMLKSQQNRNEARLKFRERPNIDKDGSKLLELPYASLMQLEMKEPVVKRPSQSGSASITGQKLYPAGRPQQKWKSQKGKIVGSHILCYFKLCAFRSPSYRGR